MDIKLEIPNLKKQQDLLKKYEKVHTKNLNRAILETLKTLQRESKIIAPRDTSWMINNIVFRNPQGLMGKLEARATYSEIVHQGLGYGRNSVARPFFTNAIRNTKTTWQNHFKKAEEDTLKEMKVR